MKWLLDHQECLSVESDVCSLVKARPSVNGKLLDCKPATIISGPGTGYKIYYQAGELPGAQFFLEFEMIRAGMLSLRYGVEGSLPVPLDTFGLHFDAVENLRAYLCNGYYSWDGSFYVQPEGLASFDPTEPRPETGYAMTQLLPRKGDGSLVIGFDRHDHFQQTFSFDTRKSPVSLTIQTHWDQKELGRHEICQSEQLVIFEHPGVEDALRVWAGQVASAAPNSPRLVEQPITGWCSWYNLYAYINEENILEHLHAAAEISRRERLSMRIFQIDDGFTPEMGDWLEVKPQFPRGMKPLLDDIRMEGFTPGLWIAPFMVGNRSRLYREHPDWVVKDRETGGPLVQWRFYGEFRWHKRSEEYYILDATHPDAFEYLRQVFHTWRWEWGCEYFKTDFMHFGSEHGPQRAQWHVQGSTRIQVWRKVAQMIRQEIGEALWLGCGCPLWASVGLVDGVRIGRDVGVEWQGNLSAQSLLRDQATRNFANGLLWQADPDCVLLRERFHHLSEPEVRSLAVYAGMSGGVMTTSDHLGELSPERLRLWRLILPESLSSCRFPFLGQTELFYERLPLAKDPRQFHHEPRALDPVLVQVRTGSLPQAQPSSQAAAVFLFNPSENELQRSYRLADLGIQSPQYIFDWFSGQAWAEPVERIMVKIAPHDSVLLFAQADPWQNAPDRLPAGDAVDAP